jgi:hypothetical protein
MAFPQLRLNYALIKFKILFFNLKNVDFLICLNLVKLNLFVLASNGFHDKTLSYILLRQPVLKRRIYVQKYSAGHIFENYY